MTHYDGNHDDPATLSKKGDVARRTKNAPEHEAAKKVTDADTPENVPDALRREPNHPENPASGRDDPLKPDK